jgi:hypothetical protein
MVRPNSGSPNSIRPTSTLARDFNSSSGGNSGTSSGSSSRAARSLASPAFLPFATRCRAWRFSLYPIFADRSRKTLALT